MDLWHLPLHWPAPNGTMAYVVALYPMSPILMNKYFYCCH